MQILQSSVIRTWLTQTASLNGNYRHLRLVENIERRQEAIRVLRGMFKEVHEDAKRYLIGLTQNDLDLLGETASNDIVEAYPRFLHLNTRKGYFGEIMAGIVAENFASTPPGQWRVPVFLFRHHQLAFDQLERWREVSTVPHLVPGQTGDDCLAFSIDADGHVTAALVGEGKCTMDHDSTMIRDAHHKVSSSGSRPVSLSRVIGILKDQRTDAEAAKWLEALQELYHRRDLSGDYKRADLVSYTCGRGPIRETDWIPAKEPHDSYSAGRELESVEVHLTNVDELVEQVYTE